MKKDRDKEKPSEEAIYCIICNGTRLHECSYNEEDTEKTCVCLICGHEKIVPVPSVS